MSSTTRIRAGRYAPVAKSFREATRGSNLRIYLRRFRDLQPAFQFFSKQLKIDWFRVHALQPLQDPLLLPLEHVRHGITGIRISVFGASMRRGRGRPRFRD